MIIHNIQLIHILWWRTTPVATKTRYHGAGGALLRARIYPLIFTSLFLYYGSFDPHVFKRVLVYFSLSLGRWVPLFRGPSLRPFLFCEPLFYFYEYGCGLWASSGPFPLLAHQGLYKRGRDPPTNPSRHLKKERSALPLKWLLKEGRGRSPTAVVAAAAAATTAATPCPGHADTPLLLLQPPPPT